MENNIKKSIEALNKLFEEIKFDEKTYEKDRSVTEKISDELEMRDDIIGYENDDELIEEEMKKDLINLEEENKNDH